MENTKEAIYDIGEISAKFHITIGGFTIGRNVFFDHLRYMLILMEEPYKNVPYKEYLQMGYFVQKTVNKKNYTTLKTFVTEKGVRWLAEQIPTIIENEINYWKEYYPKYLYILELSPNQIS